MWEGGGVGGCGCWVGGWVGERRSNGRTASLKRPDREGETNARADVPGGARQFSQTRTDHFRTAQLLLRFRTQHVRRHRQAKQRVALFFRCLPTCAIPTCTPVYTATVRCRVGLGCLSCPRVRCVGLVALVGRQHAPHAEIGVARALFNSHDMGCDEVEHTRLVGVGVG